MVKMNEAYVPDQASFYLSDQGTGGFGCMGLKNKERSPEVGKNGFIWHQALHHFANDLSAL
jgi:hypothetical protein